jgi:hypothetical protein
MRKLRSPLAHALLALPILPVVACDDAPPLPPAGGGAEDVAVLADSEAPADTAADDDATAPAEDAAAPDVTAPEPDPDCTLTPSLSALATGYFATGCAFSGCHGAGPAGGLDLRAEGLHARLVGVSAVEADAARRGKKLVVAGDPAASFLLQKVDGTHGADEGDLMPLGVDTPVSPGCRVFMLRAWIAAGALDN